jgi:hypothetical protein
MACGGWQARPAVEVSGKQPTGQARRGSQKKARPGVRAGGFVGGCMEKQLSSGCLHHAAPLLHWSDTRPPPFDKGPSSRRRCPLTPTCGSDTSGSSRRNLFAPRRLTGHAENDLRRRWPLSDRWRWRPKPPCQRRHNYRRAGGRFNSWRRLHTQKRWQREAS